MRNVSFSLRRGEILGFAGLMGAGRTEVARAVFGADRAQSGEIVVLGKKVSIQHARTGGRGRHRLSVGGPQALRPRGRHGRRVQCRDGQLARNSCRSDSSCASGEIRETANKFVKLLDIRTPSATQEVRLLSGGNQQKIVVAKWLARDCDVLFFDEPTRGIDVGAKAEIYKLLRGARRPGQGDRDDLVGAAGDPADERSHRRHVRGAHHRGADGGGRDAGADHAIGDATRIDGGLSVMDNQGMAARSDPAATAIHAPRAASGRASVRLRGEAEAARLREPILLLIYFSFASPAFMQTDNMIDILQATAVNGVLAIASTFVIITAGIDLSVGTLMTFCAVMCRRLSDLLASADVDGRRRRDSRPAR